MKHSETVHAEGQYCAHIPPTNMSKQTPPFSWFQDSVLPFSIHRFLFRRRVHDSDVSRSEKALCGSATWVHKNFFFLMYVSTFCSFISVYKTVNQKDKTFFLVFIMFFFFFNYCDCGIKLQSTNIGLNLIPRKGHLPLLHQVSMAVFLSSSDIRLLSLHL